MYLQMYINNVILLKKNGETEEIFLYQYKFNT